MHPENFDIHNVDIVEPPLSGERAPVTPEKGSNLDLSPLFHRGPTRRSRFKLALWTMASFAVDALIIIGLALSFIVISSIVTRYALPKNTIKFINQRNLWDIIFVTTMGLGWIYYLTLRLIFGATAGEYSCSLRVGQPYERIQATYPLRVLMRLVLISVTGFITLPILSLLFKTDIAGKLTKVSLYSLK